MKARLKIRKSYLIVSESDFDFEHVRHHKFIRFNRVEVVFLLLL